MRDRLLNPKAILLVLLVLFSPLSGLHASRTVEDRTISLRPCSLWDEVYRFDSYTLFIKIHLECDNPDQKVEATLGYADTPYSEPGGEETIAKAYASWMAQGAVQYGDVYSTSYKRHLVEVRFGDATIKRSKHGWLYCMYLSMRLTIKEFDDDVVTESYSRRQGSRSKTRRSSESRSSRRDYNEAKESRKVKSYKRTISAFISDIDLPKRTFEAGESATLKYSVTNKTPNPKVEFRVKLDFRPETGASSSSSTTFRIGYNKMWEDSFILSMPRPGGMYTDRYGVSRPGKGPMGRTISAKATLSLYEVESSTLIDSKEVTFYIRGQ